MGQPGDFEDDRSQPALARWQGSVAFDRAAEYYDRTRGFPAGIEQQAAELLCRAGALGAGSHVLELGIGTGRIAVPLAAHVGRVVGVDVARPMLARLRSKTAEPRIVPLLADALALPFRDARFDAVVATHVFHLLPGWRAALREAARVLAPGGRLLNADESIILRELWDQAYAGIPRLPNVGVAHGDREFPMQVGFRADGAPLHLRYPHRLSMARFLREIEERVWSATWRLSDDEHARLCANMRDAIVARFGAVEVTIDIERVFTVRAYAKLDSP
jgi:SAM-dependent methyltransferase